MRTFLASLLLAACCGPAAAAPVKLIFDTDMGNDVDDAMALAESLRLLVSSTAMAKDGTVTCSIGVAEYVGGESMDAWLSRADRALYEAKESGRNAVRSA